MVNYGDDGNGNVKNTRLVSLQAEAESHPM
jgi:hypothetical protein